MILGDPVPDDPGISQVGGRVPFVFLALVTSSTFIHVPACHGFVAFFWKSYLDRVGFTMNFD